MRVAFALDCHDREVIAWVATTAGISGEMIRDLMVECVERRFAAVRAPHPIQWLADNGSVYAAAKTLDIAIALNLAPCFTPIESPESNGVAEAFVKTFKRDYDRGRNVRYQTPPAQIRTCGIPAYGSHLGCLTANRCCGQG